MCVYLRIKFQDSSVIVKIFRRGDGGGVLIKKKKNLKGAPRLELILLMFQKSPNHKYPTIQRSIESTAIYLK